MWEGKPSPFLLSTLHPTPSPHVHPPYACLVLAVVLLQRDPGLTHRTKGYMTSVFSSSPHRKVKEFVSFNHILCRSRNRPTPQQGLFQPSPINTHPHHSLPVIQSAQKFLYQKVGKDQKMLLQFLSLRKLQRFQEPRTGSVCLHAYPSVYFCLSACMSVCDTVNREIPNAESTLTHVAYSHH